MTGDLAITIIHSKEEVEKGIIDRLSILIPHINKWTNHMNMLPIKDSEILQIDQATKKVSTLLMIVTILIPSPNGAMNLI